MSNTASRKTMNPSAEPQKNVWPNHWNRYATLLQGMWADYFNHVQSSASLVPTDRL